jgi:hypothetical protein
MAVPVEKTCRCMHQGLWEQLHGRPVMHQAFDGWGRGGGHEFGGFLRRPRELWHERALGGPAVPAATAQGTQWVMGVCGRVMNLVPFSEAL